MFPFFITGTPIEVGKTLISAALLHAFGTRGIRTAAMKPITAGAVQNHDGTWENEDTRRTCLMTMHVHHTLSSKRSNSPAYCGRAAVS